MNNMSAILSGLKTLFVRPSYRVLAIVVTILALFGSLWSLGQTTTLSAFWQMMWNGEFGSWSVAYGFIYLITSALIIAVSGVSVAAAVWLLRHSAFGRGASSGANFVGLVTGAFSMGCPVCGAFLLSAVGVAGGLSLFPLQGLELKAISLGLLVGSTIFSARRITPEHACQSCEVAPKAAAPVVAPTRPAAMAELPTEKLVSAILIIAFLANQVLIGQVAEAMGVKSASSDSLRAFFGIKTASAMVVLAPVINEDGKTTSIAELPTITEVPANPNSGDALADAKVVMIPNGVPFYAPDGISFDDPIAAQKAWGAFDKSITLEGELAERSDWLVSHMTCSYCCGSPTRVTTINRCGCAHAKASRGFIKYMLQNFGDQYSNEQILGETNRWYAIWYPRGYLSDYLLATGREDALPHETHGGAGSDGRHGL